MCFTACEDFQIGIAARLATVNHTTMTGLDNSANFLQRKKSDARKVESEATRSGYLPLEPGFILPLVRE